MSPYYRIFTAKAPVNIAVIKYWGKSNETFKIPINDSLSGTLDINEMCATTSVAVSDSFHEDGFWLNGKEQNLSVGSNARILLDEIRRLCKDTEILQYKAHIVSHNNFPTAAGLASSAAGYACLAYVLGHTYGITDPTLLSKLARRGSGSACRSLFGGFVQWNKGQDHDSSQALQIVDHKHWPEMRVVICVISDHQKDVSSSIGMSRSVLTSDLLKYRAETIVPSRIEAMKNAIVNKNFDEFANLTIRDSNQFHAICLDTYPPLFYMNEASRQVIKICSIINSFYGHNKVAYTFDAGPNACVYLLDEFLGLFIAIAKKYFPMTCDGKNVDLEISGKEYTENKSSEFDSLCKELESKGVTPSPNALSYLINTAIGEGPKLVEKHIENEHLRT